MLGNALWNSFTSKFQPEMLPMKHKIKVQGEFDRVLLLHYFWKQVNPSTAVGASAIKDEIKKKTWKS